MPTPPRKPPLSPPAKSAALAPPPVRPQPALRGPASATASRAAARRPAQLTAQDTARLARVRAAQISSQINPEFVERYQIELQKNPRSRVFAPLAEAYRKMGLIQEAILICKVGVRGNPEFAGGLVAYAKLLVATARFDEALTHLKKATHLSSDNLLAHSLMGDVLLELRQPKEALKAFKMVLFLNPDDEKAKAAVQKWEFLTAEEFAEDEFALRPVFEADPDASTAASDGTSSLVGVLPEKNPDARKQREIERALSLADAFTVRNDLASAIETLEKARRTIGPTPSLDNRLQILARRSWAHSLEKEQRITRLEGLLRCISERRLD